MYFFLVINTVIDLTTNLTYVEDFVEVLRATKKGSCLRWDILIHPFVCTQFKGWQTKSPTPGIWGGGGRPEITKM